MFNNNRLVLLCSQYGTFGFYTKFLSLITHLISLNNWSLKTIKSSFVES